MSISERLQELRKQTNYSQEEIAEKLGVTRQAISKWESGQGNPDINNIIKLSEVYSTSTDYLLTGIGSDNKTVQIECTKKNQNRVSKKVITIIFICIGVVISVPVFLVLLAFIARIFLGGN